MTVSRVVGRMRLPAFLPVGRPLDPVDFDVRHRGLLLLLWLHVPALGVFALLRGYGPGHALLEASLVAVFAVVAAVGATQRLRSVAAALGLVVSPRSWSTCGAARSRGTSTSSSS